MSQLMKNGNNQAHRKRILWLHQFRIGVGSTWQSNSHAPTVECPPVTVIPLRLPGGYVPQNSIIGNWYHRVALLGIHVTLVTEMLYR